MTLTFEHVAWAIGVVASLVGWSWWLVSRTTRAESEIKAGIAAIRTKQDQQHETNELKLGYLSERVGRVESTLNKITKVVVFPGGPNE